MNDCRQAHFFFAVSLPEEVKLILREQCERMRTDMSFKKWVHHEDYHITLAFLGAATAEKLNTAVETIKKNIQETHEFNAVIQHFGTFGKADSPRILWADLQHNEQLISLRNQVFSGCLSAGFQLETRPFTPHITLARKWSTEEHFIEGGKYFDEGLSFMVNEVVLYRTHLDQIPKYEKIAIIPLTNE
ncbi:RNA 2',3'-cyclic phosphodiesterase [Cytobacillus purgationiresistens]|uniref:RNA 2',3'-cyclic phosphodiesterase n=1 Tax=Cytobacillus purgationiresistens TaxID=863449 RepID=A0ABU0ALT3_9BACI|nr:RNA 2',3'-cyclic phosphodiesterase [Cytobacillus purgationiresistens]MDQ0272231.1 2'-5' RNA ligase [Cytobacillus purgationiresistens]